MSATGRGAERSERDYYPTPAWCVHRLLEFLDSKGAPRGRRWLEPCVGDGAIVRAAEEWLDRHTAARVQWDVFDVELRLGESTSAWPRSIAFGMVADFTWMQGAAWRGHIADARWDLCLTNPPYAQAMDFVQVALDCCDNVAMLLRINWLASEERAAWLRENTPGLYVLPNRPSFDGEGTDATDYAWFGWGPEMPRGVHVLRPTPIEVRRAA